MSDGVGFSYVLPLRWETDQSEVREDLADYLSAVDAWCEDVIVVDGSAPEIHDANRRAFPDSVRHVSADQEHECLNGKVAGVLTGLDLARHERIVIADDDVRYDRSALKRVVDLLAEHDLVRPQNYFAPLPWQARWDTARTLLNRAAGADFPGTHGVRRSSLQTTGGYDGNVMFENLELIRTIEAADGSVVSPLDLYVRRCPAATGHFWGQRTRQAYDDFAIPARMALWLSLVPGLALAARSRARSVLLLALTAPAVLAEIGRRRAGGRAHFPASSSLLAPGWTVERAICAWLAVLQRVRYGGVRYGGSVIPVAAHSIRELRAAQAAVTPDAQLRGSGAAFGRPSHRLRPPTPRAGRAEAHVAGDVGFDNGFLPSP